MAEQARLANQPRRYRLRARAAAMESTRRRITDAAVELHGTIGPAATTMTGVAQRAGVTRATLYRHFPSEEALFTACSADWLAANPRPDVERWAAIADPATRLRVALDELYTYNRSTEQMRTSLLRDLDALPTVIRAGIAAFPAAALGVLDTGWPEGSNARLRRVALAHAIAFDTWQSLTHAGLTDHEACELMLRLVNSTDPIA